jgi:hypothetical protein
VQLFLVGSPWREAVLGVASDACMGSRFFVGSLSLEGSGVRGSRDEIHGDAIRRRNEGYPKGMGLISCHILYPCQYYFGQQEETSEIDKRSNVVENECLGPPPFTWTLSLGRRGV